MEALQPRERKVQTRITLSPTGFRAGLRLAELCELLTTWDNLRMRKVSNLTIHVFMAGALMTSAALAQNSGTELAAVFSGTNRSGNHPTGHASGAG